LQELGEDEKPESSWDGEDRHLDVGVSSSKSRLGLEDSPLGASSGEFPPGHDLVLFGDRPLEDGVDNDDGEGESAEEGRDPHRPLERKKLE